MKAHVKISALFLLCLSLLTVLSCSSRTEGLSFTASLDASDDLIAQGLSKDALKLLKKLERRATTVYEWLGLFKRYSALGEDKRCEKVLKRSLKKFPQDQQVSAVYADFLLRQGRVDEAFSIALCLEEGQWSSIYAECVLRKALVAADRTESKAEVLQEAFAPASKRKRKQKESPVERTREEKDAALSEIFCDEAFAPIYESAYKGSKDVAWIFNAASIFMKTGDYEQAMLLYPKSISSARESLFWGGVFFDAGHFAESLEALQASYLLASLGSGKDRALANQILCLEADCYYVLGDEASSEQLRSEMILQGGSLPPLVYMNSAMFAKRQGDIEGQFANIDALVRQFPQYVPGLAALGEFALDEMKRPQEDEIEQRLRGAGLKTLRMERNDQLPSQTVESVIELIDEQLDEGNKEELLVLKDCLETQRAKLEGQERNVSDIWALIEQNFSSYSVYPSVLAHHCIYALLDAGFTEDAKALFTNCLKAKHPDFSIAANPEQFELWEIELAAWFACRDEDFQSALTLYTFIATRYASQAQFASLSPQSSVIVNAFVNLSVLYASTDETYKALDALNKASSKSFIPTEKAEILYRIASLHWKMGDGSSASRALKYALSLDSEHHKARLLQKKIQAGL